MSRTLSAHGLRVTVPTGWDGAISRSLAVSADADEDSGGTVNPVLHVASFALPAVRGDFGGDFLMNMGPDDVFVALVEYDRSSAGTPLFDHVGPRTIHGGAFERENMHRPIQGQSGHQQFYSVGGRAFCLYVAIGSHRRRDRLSRAAAMVPATIAIDPAD